MLEAAQHVPHNDRWHFVERKNAERQRFRQFADVALEVDVIREDAVDQCRGELTAIAVDKSDSSSRQARRAQLAAW